MKRLVCIALVCLLFGCGDDESTKKAGAEQEQAALQTTEALAKEEAKRAEALDKLTPFAATLRQLASDGRKSLESNKRAFRRIPEGKDYARRLSEVFDSLDEAAAAIEAKRYADAALPVVKAMGGANSLSMEAMFKNMEVLQDESPSTKALKATKVRNWFADVAQSIEAGLIPVFKTLAMGPKDVRLAVANALAAEIGRFPGAARFLKTLRESEKDPETKQKMPSVTIEVVADDAPDGDGDGEP